MLRPSCYRTYATPWPPPACRTREALHHRERRLYPADRLQWPSRPADHAVPDISEPFGPFGSRRPQLDNPCLPVQCHGEVTAPVRIERAHDSNDASNRLAPFITADPLNSASPACLLSSSPALPVQTRRLHRLCALPSPSFTRSSREFRRRYFAAPGHSCGIAW